MNLFLECFGESNGNIRLESGKVTFTTLNGGYYIFNDFDNTISNLHHNDSMSCFDVAKRLS
jgi:hypothetical protein